jgi:hypothetical protein
MTITVTSLTDSYLAAAPCGKNTFLLHFRADIHGALSLQEFAEMVRKYHDLTDIEIAFRDTRLDLRDGTLLSLLRAYE